MNGAILVGSSNGIIGSLNRIVRTSSRIIRTGPRIAFAKALRITPSTWIAIPGAVRACTFDVVERPGDGITRPSAVQTMRAPVRPLRGAVLTIPFDLRITLDDVQEGTSNVLDRCADERPCIVDLREIPSNLPVCIADGKTIPSPLHVCIAGMPKTRADMHGCTFDEPTRTSTVRHFTRLTGVVSACFPTCAAA